MTPNVENITTYAFSIRDRLFFDANIWLIINGPYHVWDHRTDIYSNAYKTIISQNIPIYIDTNILSEFINRYARLRYRVWCENNGDIDFKQYRSLKEYKPVAIEITDAVNTIMVDCKLVSIKYTKKELDLIISNLNQASFDFNDLLIAHTCNKCNFWLLTDDYDFSSFTNLKLLSNNSKYFHK